METGVTGETDAQVDELVEVVDEWDVTDAIDAPEAENPLWPCGNGVIDEWEECDGDALGGHTCLDFGYTGGDLSCSDDCRLLGTECSGGSVCGNGVLDSGEECDDGNDIQWDWCTDCAITEGVVNIYTEMNQRSPVVAAAPDGRFVVVWESYRQDGEGWGVFARLFDSAGRPLDTEIAVNETTEGDQGEHHVDMAADGSFVVVWRGPWSGGRGVFSRRYDAEGNALDGEFLVSAPDEWPRSSSSVAVHPSGEFAVAWCENSTTGSPTSLFTWEMRVRAFSADGEAIGDEMPVTEISSVQYGYPFILTGPGDGYSVIWRPSLAGSSGNVYMRSFDRNLEAVSHTGPLPAPGSTHAIDLTSDTTAIVVMSQESAMGDVNGIGGVYIDLETLPGLLTFEVASSGSSSSWPGAVVASDDGSFIVTWTQVDGDDYGQAVGYRRFSADCEPLGDARFLNTLTRYDQGGGDAAMASDGRHVVVWQSLGVDGDSQGIAMVLLDAEGQTRLPGYW